MGCAKFPTIQLHSPGYSANKIYVYLWNILIPHVWFFLTTQHQLNLIKVWHWNKCWIPQDKGLVPQDHQHLSSNWGSYVFHTFINCEFPQLSPQGGWFPRMAQGIRKVILMIFYCKGCHSGVARYMGKYVETPCCPLKATLRSWCIYHSITLLTLSWRLLWWFHNKGVIDYWELVTDLLFPLQQQSFLWRSRSGAKFSPCWVSHDQRLLKLSGSEESRCSSHCRDLEVLKNSMARNWGLRSSTINKRCLCLLSLKTL